MQLVLYVLDFKWNQIISGFSNPRSKKRIIKLSFFSSPILIKNYWHRDFSRGKLRNVFNHYLFTYFKCEPSFFSNQNFKIYKWREIRKLRSKHLITIFSVKIYTKITTNEWATFSKCFNLWPKIFIKYWRRA